MLIKVSNMMCINCQNKISNLLNQNDIAHVVDLENKVVKILSEDKNIKDVLKLLKNNKYNVKLIK